MNKILSLTKVLYESNKNNSKAKKGTKYFWGVLTIGYLFYIFSSFWSLMIKPLNDIGMAQMFISLIIFIGSAFVFSINVAYVPNVLYFSKDTDMLFTLPLKPKELFLSKLLIIYLYNLMITAMIIFPGFIAYGSITNSGALFYFYSIIITFLLPIIPITLITIFYTIVAQFFKFIKYQSVFKVFTTIFLIVIIMAFEFNMSANANSNGEYDAQYLLKMQENSFEYWKVFDNIFENIGSSFSVISLLLFILINLICVYGLVSLFAKLYIKGVSYNMETASHKQKVAKPEKEKTQYFALINKEIKVLFRNSSYLIQCVVPASFMPIVIFFMNYSNFEKLSETVLVNNVNEKIFIAILFAYFFTITNKISVTAISRSGRKEFEFLKSLPLTKRKIVNAKVFPGILISFGLAIISSIYFAKLFELNFASFIAILTANLILNVLENYAQIFIDMKHPKLDVENEVAIAKQNINIFVSYIISVIIIALLMFAYFLFVC